MFTLEDAIDYIDEEIDLFEQASMTNDVKDAPTELKAINRYLKAKRDENMKSHMYEVIKHYEMKY